MANNRLWLVHRPSGERVYLGKRMGYGWYRNEVDGDLTHKIQEFFDAAARAGGEQDAFALEWEDPPDKTN